MPTEKGKEYLRLPCHVRESANGHRFDRYSTVRYSLAHYIGAPVTAKQYHPTERTRKKELMKELLHATHKSDTITVSEGYTSSCRWYQLRCREIGLGLNRETCRMAQAAINSLPKNPKESSTTSSDGVMLTFSRLLVAFMFGVRSDLQVDAHD